MLTNIVPANGAEVRAHNFKDLTDQRFARLTVIELAGFRIQTGGKRVTLWNCRCDCGAKAVATRNNLTSGHTRSCGCLIVETTLRLSTKHGHANRGKVTKTYKAWSHAVKRCTNPKDKEWDNYGGRGITVCPRWHGESGFENFLADMGEAPPRLTLDRKDVNWNYEPDNCRWATRAEQAQNTRATVLDMETARSIRRLHAAGVGPTEIAKRKGVSYANVSSVIYHGCWREPEEQAA